ncbi:MAG: FmdB family zinc ribbon protein [bacterium]
MPTYDYKCKKCERLFEVVQSMNDAPITKCKECGGALKRLIGAGAGLIFKGTGFYCTDYKGKNAGAPGTSSEGKDKDAAPTKKPETETKTATPTVPESAKKSDGKPVQHKTAE